MKGVPAHWNGELDIRQSIALIGQQLAVSEDSRRESWNASFGDFSLQVVIELVSLCRGSQLWCTEAPLKRGRFSAPPESFRNHSVQMLHTGYYLWKCSSQAESRNAAHVHKVREKQRPSRGARRRPGDVHVRGFQALLGVDDDRHQGTPVRWIAGARKGLSLRAAARVRFSGGRLAATCGDQIDRWGNRALPTV